MNQQGHAATATVSKPPLAGSPEGIRLHVGGQVRAEGWTVFNIAPGPYVDIVGNCADLGQLETGSCSAIYASHVVEHLGYNDNLPKALMEFHRVLAPGGHLMVAVPDMEMLCRLFLMPDLAPDDRFMVMRMLFGGRM